MQLEMFDPLKMETPAPILQLPMTLNPLPSLLKPRTDTALAICVKARIEALAPDCILPRQLTPLPNRKKDRILRPLPNCTFSLVDKEPPVRTKLDLFDLHPDYLFRIKIEQI